MGLVDSVSVFDLLEKGFGSFFGKDMSPGLASPSSTKENCSRNINASLILLAPSVRLTRLRVISLELTTHQVSAHCEDDNCEKNIKEIENQLTETSDTEGTQGLIIEKNANRTREEQILEAMSKEKEVMQQAKITIPALNKKIYDLEEQESKILDKEIDDAGNRLVMKGRGKTMNSKHSNETHLKNEGLSEEPSKKYLADSPVPINRTAK